MHLVGILTNLDDAFKESLSEKQLEQYEKIKETLSEQRDILEFEMFTYGLKLGGQFAFAVKDDCNSQFVF